MGYVHYSWNDSDAFKELKAVIQNGLMENDFSDIKPYLILTQFLLQYNSGDAVMQQQRFEEVLILFLDIAK